MKGGKKIEIWEWSNTMVHNSRFPLLMEQQCCSYHTLASSILNQNEGKQHVKNFWEHRDKRNKYIIFEMKPNEIGKINFKQRCLASGYIDQEFEMKVFYRQLTEQVVILLEPWKVRPTDKIWQLPTTMHTMFRWSRQHIPQKTRDFK